MSISLSKLSPKFLIKVEKLLNGCEVMGCKMTPYFAERSPLVQAVLWRQSRTTQQIKKRISELDVEGATFLARCLSAVGPQYGVHVTDAIPGYSWHQWGEAVDCFWQGNGFAEWSTSRLVDGVNGYVLYRKVAEGLGLTGGAIKDTVDYPHVQLRREGVGTVYSLKEINKKMEELWLEEVNSVLEGRPNERT